MKKRCMKASVLTAILACALICAGCARSDTRDGTSPTSESSTQRVSASVSEEATDTEAASSQESTQHSESTTDAADTADTSDAPVTFDPGPLVPPETDAVTEVITDTDTQLPPAPPPATDAIVAENGTVCVSLASGAKVVLGARDSDVIGALGEYNEKLEAPSCVHPGNDVVYYYDGYTVTTSPNAAGESIVCAIGITSDAVKLANGVTVGSPLSTVKAAFGDKYTEVFGVFTYEIGDSIVQIVCDDDAVTAIAVTVEV